MCFLSICLIGCEDDPVLNKDGFTEFNVVVPGSWTLQQATQNGLDISNSFDFSAFSLDLSFNGDSPSDFTVTNGNAPFATSGSGTWTFDDLVYPTQIIFTSNGSSSTFDLANLPLAAHNNTMSIEFSLGCADNTYIYTLTK